MCVCIYIHTHSNFLFLKLIYYFWSHWVFVAASGLSLAAVSGGYFSLWCMRFWLLWLLLLRSTGSRPTGFSSWLHASSEAVAHRLLIAPWHVESSQTRNPTCVLCFSRQILYHCVTKEVSYVCVCVYTYSVKIHIKFTVLTILISFNSSVIVNTLSLLYSHHHHPFITLLVKLKLSAC